MKMLICCPLPWVDPKFGASRVALDLVDGFRANGIEYDFFPQEDNTIERLDYADVLADYLIENAHKYDVVDYPFHVRPWIQDAPNASKTLKIAKVVLLPHFVDETPDPSPPETLFRKAKRLVKRLMGRPEPKLYSPEIRSKMDQNMREADLISVANSKDKECLVPLGFEEDKIIVLPYGLTEEGANRLKVCTQMRNFDDNSRIAFVGTFDFRKGCLDFPEIIETVAKSVPNVKFRLLGTKGMFQTKEKVLQWFPQKLHQYLEIYPTFDPESLPEHLTQCHVGMFPSYREGFGIAVVEMLGAGLPVIAYNAPGPCDILPEEWLVEVGEKSTLSNKIIDLLKPNNQVENQQKALEVAAQFDWNQISKQTFELYESHHKIKLASGVSKETE